MVKNSCVNLFDFKLVTAIPKIFVSSLYWRGTRVHDLLFSGSDCYVVLRLDRFIFIKLIQLSFHASHKSHQ